MSLVVSRLFHCFVVGVASLVVLLLGESPAMALNLPNGQRLSVQFVDATPSLGIVDETCRAPFSIIANITTAPADSVSYIIVVDRSASTYDSSIQDPDICNPACGSGFFPETGIDADEFSQEACCFNMDRSTCTRNCVFNNFDSFLFDAFRELLSIPSTNNVAMANFGTFLQSPVLDFTNNITAVELYIEESLGAVFTNCREGLEGVEDLIRTTDADLGDDIVIVFLADGFCNNGAVNVPAPSLSVSVSTRLAQFTTLISIATQAVACGGSIGLEAAIRGQMCVEIPDSNDLDVNVALGSAITQGTLRVFNEETGVQVVGASFDFDNLLTVASQSEFIFSVPNLPLGRYTMSATGVARTQELDVAATLTTNGGNLIVEAVDVTPPVLTSCFSDLVVNVNPPLCQIPIFYPEPTFEDNCDAFSQTTITRTQGMPSGSTFGQEGMDTTNVITYVATDGSGNSAECSFTITTLCNIPTATPTVIPTATPTVIPTAIPTEDGLEEDNLVTDAPTTTPPTLAPTSTPTSSPTLSPITSPTLAPMATPTTSLPTLSPSDSPTLAPMTTPTTSPPTVSPGTSPTLSPMATPTNAPTVSLSPFPSISLSPMPTATNAPTASPFNPVNDAGSASVYYCLSELVANYETHLDMAMDLGGLTAVVTTEEINVLVQELANAVPLLGVSRPNRDAWIGLIRLSPNGMFQWQDGSDFEFSGFQLGQPNNLGGMQNCVELRDDLEGSFDFSWNDQDCNVEQHAIYQFASKDELPSEIEAAEAMIDLENGCRALPTPCN